MYLVFVADNILSPEGKQLLDLYHAGTLSATMVDSIIKIIKDPNFERNRLEKSFEEILSHADEDIPLPVCIIFALIGKSVTP